jgi:ATP-binding cassette, subfamily B, bacterial
MADARLEPWPIERLGDAVAALSRAAGLISGAPATEAASTALASDSEALSRWIEICAANMGVETEGGPISYGALEQDLRNAAPALVLLPHSEGTGLLAILAVSSQSATLLTPSRHRRRIPLHEIRTLLVKEAEAPLAAELARLLAGIGARGGRAQRMRAAILRERLGTEKVCFFWRLRLPAGAPFQRQVRAARLLGPVVSFSCAHVMQYLLGLLAWWAIGVGALQGRLDRGLLIAWILLLLTIVPLRLLASWKQGVLSVGAGALLKRRLLGGALAMEPDEIRRQGAGQFLGWVIESQFVEFLALSGGLAAVVAVLELMISGVTLAIGAGGWPHAVLFAGWLAFCATLARRYFKRNSAWASARLEMTHDLVERMVGHRTRLAQEQPERWHDGEDQLLADYLESSQGLDRAGTRLLALAPGGWLLLGFLALAPAFVTGAGSSASLAAAIGGLSMSYGALKRLAAGFAQCAGAAIAWRQIAPLFHAAARPRDCGSPSLAWPPAGDGNGPLLRVRDLVFRYRDRGHPILQGCDLEVERDARILLEGPSGGGKSTLAAVLSGRRIPESGLLLLDGWDRHALGQETWRRRVAAAPQFHENHVFTGTFMFNALMSREWPPRAADVAEMEAICNELGLDSLLRRMPGGALQMVGESGWQLSHGEQSRLFIARALLQRAEAVVLDESFGALDPENLRRSLECVQRRAPALLAITHT